MTLNIEKKLEHYKISRDEFHRICEKLGREPEGLEWPLFSALWSEHCSYKSSKVHLKKFFSQSERVLESFGENAGVIDLGEGERIAFKMESHNHPSYIEPTQGAATGVGGILRDIFTMGARPVILANYLCFGEPRAERMPLLIDGVVRGIGGYGNCVGVPNLTGQTEFHPSYNKNILVNAFALGLFRPGERIFTSRAKGVGNLVVYVGSQTGCDGIHGASMASDSFDEGSDQQKPTVQIGDPFMEKLLIESCLEAMAEDLVVAIQDMGAAGLTSSSFEMAARGEVGLRLDLDQVPLRQASMTPEEILLSESQERMLLICQPEKVQRLQEIFQRWSLEASVIGEVTSERAIQLFWQGERVCHIDPALLVDGAPVYRREYRAWTPKHRVASSSSWEEVVSRHLGGSLDLRPRLLSVLSGEEGSSREWVYRQYDQRVGGRTVRDASESVGVFCLPDSGRALGVTLGCRPYVMRFDACEGGKDAVAYPSIELAAKGFQPLAVTDCLNFGNPEKVDIMSEFVASVESMSQMCESLGTPVISGNVSFYNETRDENITSTPATGVVGLREDVNLPSSFFQREGDELFLVSSRQLFLSGLLSEHEGREVVGQGEVAPLQTAQFVNSLTRLVRLSPIQSSRVVGKFGLAYALARMSTDRLGCEISNSEARSSCESFFQENLYEVILSVQAVDRKAFLLRVAEEGLDVERLGFVVGSELKMGGVVLSCAEVQAAYLSQSHFEGVM